MAITTTVVRRVRDAQGAACRNCDAVFMDPSNLYWSWRKSRWLHERGTGHKMEMFRFEETKDADNYDDNR